ncbi:MAG: hypothetical protein IKV03_06815 [Alphaproteobacteria bacterium]|nr:hypothetical protein [Alphaproteobacteria bacterium]MBR5130909.1 hypothetical protein [Alphaproteobacteria bacterium]
MNFVLKNRLKVSATLSHSGRLKSVATSLSPLKMDGYMVVDFFKNGGARETCVSVSEGFVSVKTFKNNQLLTEMFKDVLYQKTFYYVYNSDGAIVETGVDSQSKVLEGNTTSPRGILMHSPVCLYDELQTDPQMLVRGKCFAIDLSRAKHKERVRAA